VPAWRWVEHRRTRPANGSSEMASAVARGNPGIAAADFAGSVLGPAVDGYPETKPTEIQTQATEANHSTEATPSARMPAAGAPVMPAFERASS
jgi:hypothetical protein